MNFEPRNLFIGLIDFFSVWLPGAVLTFVLRGPFYRLAPNGMLDGLGETELLVLFLFASYLLGHFIFLAGSILLDPAYDSVRKATRYGQAARVRKAKSLAPAWKRRLADFLFDEKDERAVNHAVMIKEFHLARLRAKDAINAFQWCKARLAIEAAEAHTIVQRFEADSKFFRSLCIVLLLLVPASIVDAAGDRGIAFTWAADGALRGGFGWLQPLALTILLAAAAWRYAELRAKSVRQAYWFIIALEGRDEEGFRLKACAPTHAGGVVWRRRSESAEILLVEDSRRKGSWVLPKGRVEPGEDRQTTAIREVSEETGCWAKIEGDLGSAEFDDATERQGAATVQFYLMSPIASAARADRRRQARWFSFGEAWNALQKESRDVLDAAAKSEMPAPQAPQAASSSAGTVSSIQPPPSSRSPS